jgi:3-dehydroquinate dehydratase-2
MAPRILVLNGPNLNTLGTREPERYGTQTLAEIETLLQNQARALNISLTFKQTNHEGELVSWIQESRQNSDGLLLNAAAFTHTSVAIRDAVLFAEIPTIEVHLSNIFARENFRQHSYLSDIVKGVICGFGADSYRLALLAMAELLKK